MKKAILTISLLIIFFICYFLQINFFSWFTIAGIKANIFIILVLSVSFFSGKIEEVILGIFIGFILDVLIGTNIGIYTISLGLISFLGWTFNKKFLKNSKITLMLLVMQATLVCETVAYFLKILLTGASLEIISFIKIILIEIMFNALITIIIYPILIIFESFIQKYSNKNEIRPRYF